MPTEFLNTDSYKFSGNGKYFLMRDRNKVHIYKINLSSIGKLSFKPINEYKIHLDQVEFSNDSKTLIGVKYPPMTTVSEKPAG